MILFICNQEQIKLSSGDLNQKVVEKLMDTNNNVKIAGRRRLGEANEGMGGCK